VLFDPAGHERLTDTRWSEARARAAIAAVVADAEGAFAADALWPAHPRDEAEGPLPAVASLYLGASGVIWALDELERAGAARLRRRWAATATGLCDRYLASPDFPEETGGEPVASLWMGEAGILLVAHRLAPARWQEERLFACVRANAGHPSRELMWGSPGTMLAACVMHERTGAGRWLQVWHDSAAILFEDWREEVWRQDLYGRSLRFLGPAHGFAGNVAVLARGDLLDDARRAELERRAVAVALRHARRDGDVAQWPAALEPPSPGQPARTQWCHGAPGMVASLAGIAPGDARLTDVLVAGGELTWRAGPSAKGAGLCHGTAGNGFAFLKLFERTGDALWLERARSFAMHAAEQVQRLRAEHGRGRYSLWTGDAGVALYLQACVAASAAVPTLDTA
jgi:hypothetical protein